MFSSILSVVAGFFKGLSAWLDWRQQQEGIKEQQLADAKQSAALAAANKEAISNNHVLSDNALDSKLRD